MQRVKEINNSADLRQVLSHLLADILNQEIELPRAREANRTASQINFSLANDIRAGQLGMEMARADAKRPALAIGPVQI
jgi:hypothetical protein